MTILYRIQASERGKVMPAENLTNGFVFPKPSRAALQWHSHSDGSHGTEFSGYAARIVPNGGRFTVLIRRPGENRFWDCHERHRTLEAAKDMTSILVQHNADRDLLGYVTSHGRSSPLSSVHSPWGRIQSVTKLGEGIFQVSTAGHGGMKVMGAAQRGMPAHLKLAGGWYEEDIDWARVALAYPDRFTSYDYAVAEKSIRNFSPDVWEANFGLRLAPEDSRQRGQEAFNKASRDRYVVISALADDTDPGLVNVYATIGGRRTQFGGPEVPEERFVVPADEYSRRSPFGFVIDEARHPRQAPARPGI